MNKRSVLEAGPVALITGLGHKSHTRALQAERSHPPLGRIINIRGFNVHLTIEGKGPAVVLIHGAGGNLRDMTFGLSAKMAATNTVIAVDRPGHGYTDCLHNRGESPAEQADLLHEALLAVGISQAILCGYSLGGAVALAWTLRHPEFVTGLLLISAVTHPWPGSIGALYNSAAHPLTAPFVVPVLSAFASENLVKSTLQSVFQPLSPPEGYLDHVGAGLSLRPHSIRANARQVARLRPHMVEMAKSYPGLTLPVEILHGTEDRSVYADIHAEKLAATLPQAVYTALPGIGHSPHHHSHPEILAALARLNGLRG